MDYKGYTGSANFSAEDGMYVGEILGIQSVVAYHGKTTHEIHEHFHDAVDDYLDLCKSIGIQPEIPNENMIIRTEV